MFIVSFRLSHIRGGLIFYLLGSDDGVDGNCTHKGVGRSSPHSLKISDASVIILTTIVNII